MQWSANNQYIPLKPYIWKDRSLYSNSYLGSTIAPFPFYRYRFVGSNLVLTPQPLAANIIRFSYTPTFTPLVNLTDTLDGVNGFEQYIVNFAAIQCLINEQQDTSQIERQQEHIEARITKLAASRDSGEPEYVAAAAQSDDSGWGSPGGGGGTYGY